MSQKKNYQKIIIKNYKLNNYFIFEYIHKDVHEDSPLSI